MSGALGRVLVVTPTYDERLSIAAVVARLRAAVPDADVLIVDDNSPDGTGDVADELAASDPAVHVLHRPRKEGLGAAYVAGFQWGLARDYQVLVEMDADGSHQPEQLPALLSALQNADLVLGSRWVKGGSVSDWPATRMALSRGGNTYVRISLGLGLRDATGGFRAFRRDLLESIDLDGVASQGYCFQVDLAWRAVRLGATVVEVPIAFVERVQGRSKMSGAIVREALWLVTQWAVALRWRQARARVGATRRGR
jgi:dolichol-phosphate mannosyltransferase